MGQMTLRRLVGNALFYALVAVIVVVALFPIYYTALTSFATEQGQFEVKYLPHEFYLGNYANILGQRGFLVMVGNSVLVALASVAAALMLAVMAAYALARVAFRGRGALLITILSVSMFPQIAILAGMWEMTRALGIYNTLSALIMAQIAFTLPFTVWLMTTFMRGLPVEIEEAAVIDGATPFVVVTRIFLPLLAPALVASGLLAFIGSWNEFLFALTLTISENKRTVPIAVSMISEFAWPITAAASVVVTLPIMLLVLVFQRRIVSGLTAGAVNG